MKVQLSLVLILGLSVAVVACGSTGSDEEVITKSDLNDRADSTLEARICRQHNKPPTCDVCQAAGWYGDGECDTFCKTKDPDCPLTCDELETWAYDVCIPDDDAGADWDSCLADSEWGDRREFAMDCCTQEEPDKYVWCMEYDPSGSLIVQATKLPTPVAELEETAGFLGFMRVTVTGGDRFAQPALNRTLAEGQRLFGEECDGVPTGGVHFDENASVDSFINYMRNETEEWAYRLSDEDLDALAGYLTEQGEQNYRIFYTDASGEACSGSGEVNVSLICNKVTNEVIYLVLYPYSE